MKRIVRKLIAILIAPIFLPILLGVVIVIWVSNDETFAEVSMVVFKNHPNNRFWWEWLTA